jgi:hypothetical protein
MRGNMRCFVGITRIVAVLVVAVSAAGSGTVTGAAPGPPFVTICAANGKPQTCLGGVPWAVYGATIYHMADTTAEIDWEIAHAKAMGLNTLQTIGVHCNFAQPGDMTAPCVFTALDYLLQQAARNGLHVVLDFSDYGHLLHNNGHVPEDPSQYAGWDNLLATYANRVNAKTGIAYKDDPTIAFVEIYGEADAPTGSDPYRPTTAQLTAFYRHTLATWKSVAPRILGTSGNLQYLDWDSGIDYRAIFADPNNAICNSEIDNPNERAITGPLVRDYCATLGKPWINGAINIGGPLVGGTSDAKRAAWTDKAEEWTVNTYRADGVLFWNLGDESIASNPNTYDFGGPSVPLTNAIVLKWACVATGVPSRCGTTPAPSAPATQPAPRAGTPTADTPASAPDARPASVGGTGGAGAPPGGPAPAPAPPPRTLAMSVNAAGATGDRAADDAVVYAALRADLGWESPAPIPAERSGIPASGAPASAPAPRTTLDGAGSRATPAPGTAPRPAPSPRSAPAPTSTTPPSGAVVDVRAYGAKGDGATDDTAAIRAAVAAAPAGATISIPAGTYIVNPTTATDAVGNPTGGITLARPVRFVGAGKGATILRVKPGRGDWGALLTVKANDVAISDLTLDGNEQRNPAATVIEDGSAGEQGTWQVAIRAGGDNLSVRRVSFPNQAGVWALVAWGSNTVVADCDFTFTRAGATYDNSLLYLSSGTNFAVTGNTLTAAQAGSNTTGQRGGIEMHGSGVAYGNTLVRVANGFNLTNGIGPRDAAGPLDIHDNTLVDVAVGVSMWPLRRTDGSAPAMAGTRVHHNTIGVNWQLHGGYGYEGAGVALYWDGGATAPASDMEIDHNTISFNSAGAAYPHIPANVGGITVTNAGGAARISIHDNTINAASYAGIMVGQLHNLIAARTGFQATYSAIQIVNNTINDPGYNDVAAAQYRSGIYVSGVVSRFTIVGNTVTHAAGMTQYGIYYDRDAGSGFTDMTPGANALNGLPAVT